MLAISSLEEEERDIPILSEGSEVYDQLYPMEDQSVVDIEDCGVGLPAECCAVSCLYHLNTVNTLVS